MFRMNSCLFRVVFHLYPTRMEYESCARGFEAKFICCGGLRIDGGANLLCSRFVRVIVGVRVGEMINDSSCA